MKSLAFFFLLYLNVFDISFVESGVILDSITTGIHGTTRRIKCGAHQIGGLVTQNRNNNCAQTQNEIDTNENPVDKNVVDKQPEGHELVRERTNERLSTSTQSTAATVPGGRRIIGVGANCPDGFRGDGKGNCREEY